MVLNTEWAQVEVIDLINDGSGLAFGIIGGRSTGVVVKTILPGGVADRDGRLQSGDHILQIGEVNLRGLGSEQVASVLRQCGIHVRMVVARPVESASADYQTLGSQAPIVPTRLLGDPAELDRHLIENGYAETASQLPTSSAFTTSCIYSANQNNYSSNQNNFQSHPISGAVDVVKNPLPIGKVPSTLTPAPPPLIKMLPLDMALHKPNLPEVESYEVELKKDDLGLGITVAGYVCESEEISGIFVKSISPGSAAAAGTKKIRVNDRIVEVDGVSVIGQSNHQAVELLKNAGPLVKLTFERYLRGPKYEQLQQAIKANEANPSQSPITSTITTLPKIPLSLVKTSFLGIEPEGESRTSFDFDSAVLLEDNEEILVDGSAQSHESIYRKWREKLDAEVVIAEMYKEANGGLGISLEGTVDVEDGKEVRPHHYIRNILPGGPVGQNNILRSGDELLEVNGIQLFGLNHLEVVAILKQLKNYVCFVCARSPSPIRIIDTSQHREAFRARNILAGSLQTLIPYKEVLVKAKSETSLASSFHSDQCNGSRSRSLEVIAGLPMWQSEPSLVEIIRTDHGLGFSILDYQDPLNPQESVIVIRSLVPGGVAQLDGRLIPGDRLLAVNSINLEHATLDRAVQVLKTTPKGPVSIKVAKPLSASKNGQSHASQDTEEDQTYDDFQECLEEYQECLEVVQICIEDDKYEHSPYDSQMDDLLTQSPVQKPDQKNNEQQFQTNNFTINNSKKINAKKTDSTTQSMTYSSTQDGYDTCVDESLSEEGPKILDEITPTNSKLYISENLTMIDADEEEDAHDSDEFILVEYPPELGQGLCVKRPSRLVPFGLTDYFNDYDYFIESYTVQSASEIREEMGDEEIFCGIPLMKIRSNSAPEIQLLPEVQQECTSFLQLQSSAKRKSLPMTVIESRELEIAKTDQNVGEMLQKHWGSTHTVEIYREPNASLGISIVGGKVDLHPDHDKILGIFIKNVVPDSPAGRSGKFKVGDRILQVSGVDLSQETHEKAVQVIKNAPNPVIFVIQSLIPWKQIDEDVESTKKCPINNEEEESEAVPNNDHLNDEENDEQIDKTEEEEKIDKPDEEEKNEVENEVAVSPLESDEEDDVDVRDLEGRTVSSKGQQIDRASAGNLNRTQEEISADSEEEDDFGYTTNKVKKKYANLGHTIIMVQLERSNQGLGLSLAGHKDRNCMAVFVCGMNPNGAAYKAGNIQIGDEILEVNGVVLHGRCHLNASAIIKGLSGPIFKIILLRRKTAVDDIAVKPITQFPVSLAEEASEERFSATYPNVRTVTIKKGSHSLGIMIIEGKHTEVGQGIFISNIQEGSFAEKAGLEIGELILAVNKDSLVGSTYDTAANLLKRTEGLVTLVVSNPGKKTNTLANSNSQLENNKNSLQTISSLKAPGPPSRPSTPVPEPAIDPATCAITPGKETTIEITTDNKGLGIFFIGGKDTMLSNGIVVGEVFPGGNADKDNRLRPGDQMLECNGISLKDVTFTMASQALRQTLPKMRMVIYRQEKIEYTNLDVELVKKPGKGMGISVIANKSGKGVYVADVINGGAADVDGKIMRGDIIISVNGQNVENCSSEEAGLLLKTISGRVFLKLNRYKPVAR